MSQHVVAEESEKRIKRHVICDVVLEGLVRNAFANGKNMIWNCLTDR